MLKGWFINQMNFKYSKILYMVYFQEYRRLCEILKSSEYV